ncbi:hypothetical protein TRFO_09208 [Tritrichomonas foetus]|uniref:Uncharacterized protein n=1 Tax=Tritrichomonas foetus TaxID=1144522 RepID=A0A1J4JF71_9EUKA|nr:hypothetical protein TRFO_09208 [Tritrichomonas foetus]|eukprot:OHS97794.1 hypothetical protein TRFO_09208 [Tritrichomonas foetus]
MQSFKEKLEAYAKIILTQKSSSEINLNIADCSDKCQKLSIEYKGKYADTWLLLSILLRNFTAKNIAPFYQFPIDEENINSYINLIKFLTWLEYIYRKYHNANNEKNIPLVNLRCGAHDKFLSSFKGVFDTWKAETFRGLFDNNLETKNKSYDIFQEYAIKLANSGDIPDLEREYYLALTGDEKSLVNLLPKDEHNEMWATLFSHFLTRKQFEGFNVKSINKFTPIEFQQFCFCDNLENKLQNTNFIGNAQICDDESLVFYLNLAILFQNKEVAKLLLPSYLKLLIKYEMYEEIKLYTTRKMFEINDVKNSEKKYDTIEFVVDAALSIDNPTDAFISPFQEDSKTLLSLISKKIINSDWKDPSKYMNAPKWLRFDQGNSDEFTSTAMQVMYKLVLKNELNIAWNAFELVSTKFPALENHFWMTFLDQKKRSNSNEMEAEYIQETFKSLLHWTVSLKGESVAGFKLLDNEEAISKSEELIQHLFTVITKVFQNSETFQKLKLMKNE